MIATDWWTGRGVVGGEAARAGQLRVGRGRGLSGREEATAILIDVRCLLAGDGLSSDRQRVWSDSVTAASGCRGRVGGAGDAMLPREWPQFTSSDPTNPFLHSSRDLPALKLIS